MQIRPIAELDFLEDLEELQERYRRHYGSLPFNVSHWDPGDSFRGLVTKYLDLETPENLIDYSFSYNLPNTKSLLEKLGFDANEKGCLITPSGSVSILATVCYLHSLGIKRVTALCPCYFTLPHSLSKLGMKLEKIYLQRDHAQFTLPSEETFADAEVVWITNPVYCASVYLPEVYNGLVSRLTSAGKMVIVDECLSVQGRELSRDTTEFIGLYCPHKSVCVNGLKFSAIVFNRSDQTFFDQWADVLYGCLSPTNVLAVRHFLSPNFDRLSVDFGRKVCRVMNEVEAMCSSLPNIELDSRCVGYLATIYAKGISAESAKSAAFLWDVIKSTGAVFIPGSRNHFSNKCGLCFRINLARHSPRFHSSLQRLVNYLDYISPHLKL